MGNKFRGTKTERGPAAMFTAHGDDVRKTGVVGSGRNLHYDHEGCCSSPGQRGERSRLQVTWWVEGCVIWTNRPRGNRKTTWIQLISTISINITCAVVF